MIIRNIAITAGMLGIVTLAFAAQAAKVSSAQDFVTHASIADQFEINTSKLAQGKSKNAEVKEFAARMITDHTKSTAALKKALSSSPSKATPAAKLDEKHQKDLDSLASVNGKEFDTRYIALQKDAHKEAVSLFTDYSQHGDDKALKTFAGNTLPTLKDHMKHVQKLSAK